MIRPDELWKSILEDLLEEAVRYFFPVFCDEVDWTVAPVFMDKELAKISPKSKTKGRVADKLVKLRLLDGSDCWLLVLFEVQGYPDVSFAKRMVQMRVRLLEHFDAEVVSLAIYTDDDERFCPDCYEETRWGNRFLYQWNVFKLSANPPERLRESDNIFAIVLEVAYHRLKKHRLTDEDLLAFKVSLLERLKKTNLPERKINNLLNFIELYVNFQKPEIAATFERKLDNFKKIKPNMSTFDLKIREEKRKARKEGREVGREEGIDIGFEKAIMRLLQRGFDPASIAQDLQVPLEKVLEVLKKMNNDAKI